MTIIVIDVVIKCLYYATSLSTRAVYDVNPMQTSGLVCEHSLMKLHVLMKNKFSLNFSLNDFLSYFVNTRGNKIMQCTFLIA